METLRTNIGMFSVNQLNCYHVIMEAFNVIHFGSSNTIQEKWKPNNERPYSNRRKNNVQVPRVNHVKCQGFSWYGAKLWNSLPEEIKTINEPKLFQIKIKKHIWESIPSF